MNYSEVPLLNIKTNDSDKNNNYNYNKVKLNIGERSIRPLVPTDSHSQRPVSGFVH